MGGVVCPNNNMWIRGGVVRSYPAVPPPQMVMQRSSAIKQRKSSRHARLVIIVFILEAFDCFFDLLACLQDFVSILQSET